MTACTNLCKTSTQQFFSENWGLPLTMKPNFEDLSCDMIFGQPPPPRELDDAYTQPCLATVCMTKALGMKPSKYASNEVAAEFPGQC